MDYKKNNLSRISLIILALALMFAVNFAAAESNYCCEKTLSGAFCQNAPQSECDSAFRAVPTSCESTSYCKPGCCFDSIEGLCMESTPQRVCSSNGGTWENDSSCNVPECNLGCCILGNQAAFVTLTRCKQLSGFYQLTTDFRNSISDEITCIATAQGEDTGACVYADPALLINTCTFTTRSSCKGSLSTTVNETNATLLATGSKAFYKDILCSAEELETICGPSTETTLVDGKDEVYFTDTCGNIANIYDASRYNDKQYWKKVYKKSESCGAGSSNANSRTCGNCDYYLGSIGKKTGFGSTSPTYGNNICIDLSCKSAGKKNGESWCVTDSPTGNGQDTVGSRYFKEVCISGEVLTEPCADFRNEICIEGEFDGFSEAACRVNRWQDCLAQKQESDCTNYDARDCKWTGGYYYSTTTGQIEKSTDPDTQYGYNNPTPQGICTPNYPPGFAFWGSSSSSSAATGSSTGNFSATTPGFSAQTPAFGTGYVSPTSAGTDASTMCGIGNTKLKIQFKQTVYPLKILGDSKTEWSCDNSIGNCQYVTKDSISSSEDPTKYVDAVAWAADMNKFCYQLGDCGGYTNWLSKYTEDGFAAYHNNYRIAGSGGAEVIEKTKEASTTTTTGATGAATGNVVKDLIKSVSEKS